MNLTMIIKKSTIILLAVFLCLLLGGRGMTTEIDYAKILEDVADRIASYKKDFPQLKEFSPTKNTNLQNLSIEYSFHTHPAQNKVGWRAGVPNPDDDGIWFYIDFHDSDSIAQIHTQPVVPTMCIGKKIAFLLILEGKNTKPLCDTIWGILEEYGAKPCGP
ncbi:MAG: hypothetical protein JXA50_11230 [Deltaproteobacteria bacterium]|nr:hypothetical protein [Deltaproteobacteria bacterium]